MSEGQQPKVNLRIAILGYEKVGKTILYRKLVSEARKRHVVFIDDGKYTPTFGFTTFKIDWLFNIGNETIPGLLTIFDTAGHDLNQTLTKAHYSSFDAFIFVFDTRDPSTLTYVYQEFKRIQKLKNKIYGCVIGNTFGDKVPTGIKQRTSDLVKGYGGRVEYVEVSILEEVNLNASFMVILDRLVYSIVIRFGRGVWV